MSFIIIAVLLVIYRQLLWLDRFHDQLNDLLVDSAYIHDELNGFYGQIREIQSLLTTQAKQERIKFVTSLLHHEVLKEVRSNTDLLPSEEDELFARLHLKRLHNKHDRLCMKQRGSHYDFSLCNVSTTTIP